MDPADLSRSCQVGYGTSYAKHPMKTASGQPHRCRRIGQKLASGIVGRGNFLQNLAVRLGNRSDARSIVSVGLELSGRRNPAGNLGAPLGRWGKREIGGRNSLNFDVQVDSIQQRSRNTRGRSAPCSPTRPAAPPAARRATKRFARPASVRRRRRNAIASRHRPLRLPRAGTGRWAGRSASLPSANRRATGSR